MSRDLAGVASWESLRAGEKWEARVNGRRASYTTLRRRPNLLRGVPSSWAELANTAVTPCPLCRRKGVVTSWAHMRYVHRVNVESIASIWREHIASVSSRVYKALVGLDGKVKLRAISRASLMQRLEPLIQEQLSKYADTVHRMVKEIRDFPVEVVPFVYKETV